MKIKEFEAALKAKKVVIWHIYQDFHGVVSVMGDAKGYGRLVWDCHGRCFDLDGGRRFEMDVEDGV